MADHYFSFLNSLSFKQPRPVSSRAAVNQTNTFSLFPPTCTHRGWRSPIQTAQVRFLCFAFILFLMLSFTVFSLFIRVIQKPQPVISFIVSLSLSLSLSPGVWYEVITFGAPADHHQAFKHGGLKRLLSKHTNHRDGCVLDNSSDVFFPSLLSSFPIRTLFLSVHLLILLPVD